MKKRCRNEEAEDHREWLKEAEEEDQENEDRFLLQGCEHNVTIMFMLRGLSVAPKVCAAYIVLVNSENYTVTTINTQPS